MTRATLANWQEPPQNRWAYQHIRELIPTERIRRGTTPHSVMVSDDRDVSTLVDPMLAATHTDAFVLAHQGRIVHEHFEGGMDRGSSHLLFSVSKSLCGTLVGILIERGEMDPEVLITHYLPELADTSWSGCSLRHLLDMRSGVRFSEDYTDPDCDIFVTDAIIGWGPPDSSRDDFWAYIAQLPADEPHGTRFGYRSIQTDLLGWIVERVTGLSYAQAMSTFIWSGIGAEYDADMTVNPRGQSLPAGGISATAHDVLRFGEHVRLGGAVAPRSFVDDTLRGDAECRRAWLEGPLTRLAPDGHYRNQWWVRDPAKGVMFAIGTNGQLIYIDRSAEMVAVKLSSWPVATSRELIDTTTDALEACAAALGGGA